MPIYHDITIPVSPDTPPWPGDAPTEIETTWSIAQGDGCNVSKLTFSSHAATHVDAPYHFLADGAKLDAMPLDALIGPAWVAEFLQLDVIDASDLESVVPQDVERLLLKTKNSTLWQAGRQDFVADFVYITPDAAEWVVRRGIKLIANDYLSVQQFKSPEPTTHQTLLRNGVVILEGVNLTGIRPGKYGLVCLPLLVPRCDGAPARTILIKE